MESSRIFARRGTATVVVTVVCVFIASLSTASEQGTDRCEPSSVRKCYLSYREAIFWNEFRPSPEGVYDEEEFKNGCSLIKAKLPCHYYRANCTDVVNGNYSIQERGYEAMRDIICDGKALKDFHTAFQCRNETMVDECAKTREPASDPRNPDVLVGEAGRCRLHTVELACFEQAFNSSCPLPLKTAKTAFTRVVDAIALLDGCPLSANAAAASRGFLALLVVPVILSWLRT